MISKYAKKVLIKKNIYAVFNSFIMDVLFMEKDKVECPKCGKDLVETIYGMPSPEIMKQYEKGEVLLGGCEIIEGVEQVKYTCFNCGTEFSKDLKELGPIFIPDELNIESEE